MLVRINHAGQLVSEAVALELGYGNARGSCRLQNYESCKNYAQEIHQKINEMKKLPSGSSQRAKVIGRVRRTARWLFSSQVSSTIRTMMTEFNKDVDRLSNDLTAQSRSGSM